MPDPVPPLLTARHALFIDLDGTLLEHTEHPGQHRPDPTVPALLHSMCMSLQGALAVISGRPITSVDRFTLPHRFAVAGLHGLELRHAATKVQVGDVSVAAIERARSTLAIALSRERGVLLEDKGSSLAVHYRRAPEREEALVALAERAARAAGPGFRVLRGAYVVELIPTSANKGTAVRQFMELPPFRGRQPVSVGDDYSDLDGFDAARRLGGFGVAVGPRVHAEYRLGDVSEVRMWLQRSATRLAAQA